MTMNRQTGCGEGSYRMPWGGEGIPALHTHMTQPHACSLLTFEHFQLIAAMMHRHTPAQHTHQTHTPHVSRLHPYFERTQAREQARVRHTHTQNMSTQDAKVENVEETTEGDDGENGTQLRRMPCQQRCVCMRED